MSDGRRLNGGKVKGVGLRPSIRPSARLRACTNPRCGHRFTTYEMATRNSPLVAATVAQKLTETAAALIGFAARLGESEEEGDV